jgi:hypothetical protein
MIEIQSNAWVECGNEVTSMHVNYHSEEVTSMHGDGRNDEVTLIHGD